MRLVFKERPDVSTVSVQVWIAAGAACESKRGTAHFLEHMVFNGTEEFSAGQIDELIESHAGDINAATSYDYTVYYVNILKEHAEIAFKVLSQLTTAPTFPKESFEKEKEVILEEIAMSKNTPDSALFRKFNELLFKNLPYRYEILGDEQSVKNMTVKDLKDFMRSFYTDENVIIAVSGNFDRERARELVKRYFKFPCGKRNCSLPKEPPHEAAKAEVSHPLSEIPKKILGWKIQNPNRAALYLLETFLMSRTSPIREEIIDKGLAYSVDVSFSEYKEYGVFSIVGKFEDEKSFSSALYDLIKRILSKFSLEEFEFSKRSFFKTREFLFEDPSFEIEEDALEMLLGWKNLDRAVRKLKHDEFLESISFLSQKPVEVSLVRGG